MLKSQAIIVCIKLTFKPRKCIKINLNVSKGLLRWILKQLNDIKCIYVILKQRTCIKVILIVSECPKRCILKKQNDFKCIFLSFIIILIRAQKISPENFKTRKIFYTKQICSPLSSIFLLLLLLAGSKFVVYLFL